MIKYLPLTLLLTLISACSDDNILSLDERSIIYCSEGSPDTFNPQLTTSGTTSDATSKQLYNSLIEFDNKKNTIIPALASSWHITKDGKKITFYLRKDVSFHHTHFFKPTRMMNADDVLFSFERILDKENLFHYVSGGQYPFFEGVKFTDLVEGIEKINDYTLRFSLKRSDSSFLSNLATDYAVILSEEYSQQLALKNTLHEIDIFPIGTGPFKFKDYRVGSLIRYYRHENYWQGKAKIEQLVFDISPSKTSRFTKLLARECDVSSYPIAHEKIAERPDLLIESNTSSNVGYFGFNTLKPPFDSKLVRQAVSLAINKPSLIDTIYGKEAVQAKSILPESSWAYDRETTASQFNPIKAKALLTQAGYPEGFSMDIWAMPVQRAYNPNAVTMAKLIQADLKKIGINVKIVSYEWSTFLRRLSLGEHQSFLLGWTADHPDPDTFFTPILGCSADEKGSNFTFWCHEDYEQLIKSALKTNNIEKRKALYAQAMALIQEEVPLLPIAHSKRFQARSHNVAGNILSDFGAISFYHTYKIDTPDNSEQINTSELMPRKQTDKGVND